MSDTNLTAKDLCELANRYRLSAADLVGLCIRVAKSTADSSGFKEVSVPVNSRAVSDEELAAATGELEAKGFRVSSTRSGDWLNITVNFDVCR